MGKKINVYFNICVLPHKKQFERVPCSFDGFPYLNSFHTSALAIPGDCRRKGLIAHPWQSTLWVKAVQNSCWWQRWCPGFPLQMLLWAPGCAGCGRLGPAISVLQMNICWVSWFCRVKISSVLLRFSQCWWEKSSSLPPPPVSQPSAVPSLPSAATLRVCSSQQGFYCCVFPPWDTWMEALPRDKRGQWCAFFYLWNRVRVLVILSLHEANLPKQKRVR